jgi:hypothetical protein
MKKELISEATLHNQDVRQCATEGNDYGVTDRAKAR